jgi:hypothetical protein
MTVPVGSEQDRDDMKRDDERLREEIRRLFERYRETARHATASERDESAEDSPALTLR